MESNENTALIYEIALSRIPGVGSIHYKSLVNHFGSAQAVLEAPKAKILNIPGIGPLVLSGFEHKSEQLLSAEKTITDSLKKDIEIIHLNHPDYPESLKRIYDSPPIIFTKGNGEIFKKRTLAVVGTRNATDYGKWVVEDLAGKLNSVQIISGLAFGIDIAAHKAALKNQLPTIAVLAHGLETVYPSLHQKTAEEILEHNGLLISEQPPFSKMHPQFFISRNRIIAALSEVVLVVESAKKGGSIVTAEFANNYNKDVFAVPGEISKKQSEGTNFLIFQNKAHIYTNAKDFINWMDWDASKNKKEKIIKIDLSQFSDEERVVIQQLSENKEMLIDNLSWQTGIGLNKLSSILLNLEFMGLVNQAPGKKFSIKK